MLICYDRSADAEQAIDSAAVLLSPRHAVVLDVAAPLTVAESFAEMSSVVPGTAFEDLNEADALQGARAGAARAVRAGLPAEARASVAAPRWEGIVEVANELDAAVIVVGSRGLSGLREVAHGSPSHQLAEHARRPVLIVPPRTQNASAARRPQRTDAANVTGRPILICYDGSERARAAVETAAALLTSRQAVVLDVVPVMIAEGYSAMPSDAPWVDQVDVTEARERAEAGAELARRLGFEAEARADSATSTWRGVTEVADAIDAAVIAIGSRGLKGLREVVERSISHDVATHARRPVLIVPPGR